jgi:hypothetical protein
MSFAQWILIGIATVALVIGVSLLFARIAAFNESEPSDDERMDSIKSALKEDVAGVRLVKRRHVRAGSIEQ